MDTCQKPWDIIPDGDLGFFVDAATYSVDGKDSNDIYSMTPDSEGATDGSEPSNISYMPSSILFLSCRFLLQVYARWNILLVNNLAFLVVGIFSWSLYCLCISHSKI